MALRIPLSTYRLQFSLAFRFVDARDLVPYLEALGVSDLYSSPRFKARRGSPHAYDVANPLRINSELGTEEEFEELAAKLDNYGMGLLLDVVPNHMAASSENPWWMDLLENGQDSLYSRYFAVDWNRGGLKTMGRQKVVLPILGDLYGAALENQEFSLKLDENGFFLKYCDHRLPLDPKSYGLVLEGCRAESKELAALVEAFAALPAGDPSLVQRRHLAKEGLKRRLWASVQADPALRQAVEERLIELGGARGVAGSFDALDRILGEQPWRLAYWRMASEELNYRRFFDITDLVAVRMEDPEVFASRHQGIVGLVRREHVTGLRVDHIDGLRDPKGYLERLRSMAAGEGEFYIVVEKILSGSETLPEDWTVSGTTGYDFLNYLNGLFVDQAGVAALDALYREFTGVNQSFLEIRTERKKQVMRDLFAGEVRALGYHLGRLAVEDRFARDLPFRDMLNALVEITARLPVYRTYFRDGSMPAADKATLEPVICEAEREAGGEPASQVFAFLRRVLLLEIPHYVADKAAWASFVKNWQQFTGPVAAKGYEDTACYVYNRLMSQNEVGGDPDLADHPATLEDFHARNRARLTRWPHTLNATATHDTKRSEDVRARLNVLSEIPGAWGRRLAKWSRWNAPAKKPFGSGLAPVPNDELLIYQALIGVWPLAEEEAAGVPERLKNYVQKALREAKTYTNWLKPDEAYESAASAFIDAILDPSHPFLKDFLAFHKRIAQAGAVNSLAQTLLKIASPGTPDFYQGTELWDFSLVDPDNRRPVDFGKRAALLDELRRAETQDLAGLIDSLCTHWRDGRIKLYATYKALGVRRAHSEAFQRGEYIPLDAGENVCAFARRTEKEWIVAAAPRRGAYQEKPARRLSASPSPEGAVLKLPSGAPARWCNVFTGQETESAKGALDLAALLSRFPIALLEPR